MSKPLKSREADAPKRPPMNTPAQGARRLPTQTALGQINAALPTRLHQSANIPAAAVRNPQHDNDYSRCLQRNIAHPTSHSYIRLHPSSTAAIYSKAYVQAEKWRNDQAQRRKEKPMPVIVNGVVTYPTANQKKRPHTQQPANIDTSAQGQSISVNYSTDAKNTGLAPKKNKASLLTKRSEVNNDEVQCRREKPMPVIVNGIVTYPTAKDKKRPHPTQQGISMILAASNDIGATKNSEEHSKDSSLQHTINETSQPSKRTKVENTKKLPLRTMRTRSYKGELHDTNNLDESTQAASSDAGAEKDDGSPQTYEQYLASKLSSMKRLRDVKAAFAEMISAANNAKSAETSTSPDEEATCTLLTYEQYQATLPKKSEETQGEAAKSQQKSGDSEDRREGNAINLAEANKSDGHNKPEPLKISTETNSVAAANSNEPLVFYGPQQFWEYLLEQKTKPITFSDIDSKKYPILSKVKHTLGDEYNEQTQQQLFIDLTRVMKDGHVVNASDNRSMKQTWIQIPVNESEVSFKYRVKSWFGEILKTNGGKVGVDEAARRICNYLAVHHEKPMMQSLMEKRYPIVQYMDEKKLDAMCKEARLNATNQEVVVKHLRAHFGVRAFASNLKQREARKAREEAEAKASESNGEVAKEANLSDSNGGTGEEVEEGNRLDSNDGTVEEAEGAYQFNFNDESGQELTNDEITW